MIIKINTVDLKALAEENVDALAEEEMSVDEALELMDKIRDIEVYYSQNDDMASRQKASLYADIAERIGEQF